MYQTTLLIILVISLIVAVSVLIYLRRIQTGSKKHVFELENSLADEKRLEQLREEFTAMMIHELRTPLTTVSYTVDAIVHDPKNSPSDSLKQYLTIIKSTTDEMLELVNELLDVAKIEAGKFEIVKKEDDLGKLIEEKLAVFKPLTDQRHLKLVEDTAPDLEMIAFDRIRLGQVLDNLLSNSIKYTTAGQIVIKTRKENNQMLISVTDTGEGISAEDMPKLFSKFEQLGKGKSGEKSGTGLGLVIAKGIVEAHGGSITASSAGKGHGATFTFSIPIA